MPVSSSPFSPQGGHEGVPLRALQDDFRWTLRGRSANQVLCGAPGPQHLLHRASKGAPQPPELRERAIQQGSEVERVWGLLTRRQMCRGVAGEAGIFREVGLGRNIPPVLRARDLG